MNYIKYFFAGTFFGIVLVKAEVISWFRIQEMFRFQSFHMYGVMMSAMAVGITSIFLIKKFNVKTIHGEEIVIAPKKFTWGNVIGGIIFGLGWAMTGACPGPLYALVGSGVYVIAVALLSALLGTFVYGYVQKKLPH
jgi:uncharacterized membrane protein YedE/YeeE